MKQCEAGWNQKVTQIFTETEQQVVKKSYINPKHFSLFLSKQVSHSNLPPPQNSPFSVITHVLNKYDLLSILYTYIPRIFPPSKVTQPNLQYLPWPTYGSYKAVISTDFAVWVPRHNSTGEKRYGTIGFYSFSTALATRVGNQTTKRKIFYSVEYSRA